MGEIKKQSKSAVQGTKKCIIDIARRLFSEYSYLGVSMNDIAKKLNITKAALYYHFTSKTEIYKKVLDDVFNDLSLSIKDALNETIVERKLHKLVKNYLDFGFREKNLVTAIMLKLSPADSRIRKHIIRLRRRITNLIQTAIEEMFSNKKLSRKINGKSLASLLTSMMDGLLLEHSFLHKKINSEKMSSQIIAILFKGRGLIRSTDIIN